MLLAAVAALNQSNTKTIMNTEKQKHTQGPWNVIRTPSLWIQGEPDTNGFRTVCTFPDHFAARPAKQLADAQLIAAAPDLLAALKAILGLYASGADNPEVRFARQTIAQAEKGTD